MSSVYDHAYKQAAIDISINGWKSNKNIPENHKDYCARKLLDHLPEEIIKDLFKKLCYQPENLNNLTLNFKATPVVLPPKPKVLTPITPINNLITPKIEASKPVSKTNSSTANFDLNLLTNTTNTSDFTQILEILTNTSSKKTNTPSASMDTNNSNNTNKPIAGGKPVIDFPPIPVAKPVQTSLPSPGPLKINTNPLLPLNLGKSAAPVENNNIENSIPPDFDAQIKDMLKPANLNQPQNFKPALKLVTPKLDDPSKLSTDEQLKNMLDSLMNPIVPATNTKIEEANKNNNSFLDALANLIPNDQKGNHENSQTSPEALLAALTSPNGNLASPSTVGASTQPTPFYCDKCEKYFKNNAGFKMHIRSHKMKEIKQATGGVLSPSEATLASTLASKMAAKWVNSNSANASTSGPLTFNGFDNSGDDLVTQFKQELENKKSESENKDLMESILNVENKPAPKEDIKLENLTNSSSNNLLDNLFNHAVASASQSTPNRNSLPVSLPESPKVPETFPNLTPSATPPPPIINNINLPEPGKKPEFQMPVLSADPNMLPIIPPNMQNHGPSDIDPSTIAITVDKETGERKHLCTICGYVSKRYADLRDHQRIHSDERPFQCNMCSAKFKQRQTLRNHKRNVHKIFPERTRGRKRKDANGNLGGINFNDPNFLNSLANGNLANNPANPLTGNLLDGLFGNSNSSNEAIGNNPAPFNFDQICKDAIASAADSSQNNSINDSNLSASNLFACLGLDNNNISNKKHETKDSDFNSVSSSSPSNMLNLLASGKLNLSGSMPTANQPVPMPNLSNNQNSNHDNSQNISPPLNKKAKIDTPDNQNDSGTGVTSPLSLNKLSNNHSNSSNSNNNNISINNNPTSSTSTSNNLLINEMIASLFGKS